MHLEVPARIGVLSDTHGVLAPRIPGHFEGVDAIVHAGDIGSPTILMELEAVAPLVAVRGNTDESRWAEELPVVATLSVGAYRVTVVHDECSSALAEADIVVVGHTHRPRVERLDGRLHVNPGSATRPRGSGSRPSIALLDITEDGIEARIISL